MLFEQILFFLAGAGALAGALGVVLLRNPFYSVLALVAHLVSLAVLFLLLRAEFLAAAQVVVYAGAVMVLYVFVVAYIGGADEPLRPEAGALGGITRAVVIRMAKEEGLEVVEKNLTRFDLYTCDEFFLTGTAAEVIGIVDIDGRIVGDGKPGPITKLLRKKFFKYAHGKEK